MTPRLDLVTRCDGAGKSTLVERHLQPLLRAPIANADEIAKSKWPDDPEARSYEAARVAAETRNAPIDMGRSSRTDQATIYSNERAITRFVARHVDGVSEGSPD